MPFSFPARGPRPFRRSVYIEFRLSQFIIARPARPHNPARPPDTDEKGPSPAYLRETVQAACNYFLLERRQMCIFSASAISSSRNWGWAMLMMDSARCQVVMPFTFTLPYSVTR